MLSLYLGKMLRHLGDEVPQTLDRGSASAPPPLAPNSGSLEKPQSKPHNGTVNGLRDGTQFGVPMQEELVIVCLGMRGDAGQVK